MKLIYVLYLSIDILRIGNPRTMKNFFAVVIIIILIGLSCKKGPQKETETKMPETLTECGVILATPVLDSFIYPTYYITALVAFPDGNETVHFHDNVTGDHDGSWFLPRYDKDSTFCIAP